MHHRHNLHLLTRATSEETLDLGTPDQMMTPLLSSLYLLRASFLKQLLDGAGRGGLVYIYRVNGAASGSG
jgi:hypothetical protein